jgi:hypothetical protein
MALTSAQTTQLYEIFGVPQSGVGRVANTFADLSGSLTVRVDLSYTETSAALAAAIAALSEAQITRVAALLTDWDSIGSQSELAVSADGGTSGTLVDHAKRRANIRDALANILGFMSAQSFAQAARVFGPGGNRLLR